MALGSDIAAIQDCKSPAENKFLQTNSRRDDKSDRQNPIAGCRLSTELLLARKNSHMPAYDSAICVAGIWYSRKIPTLVPNTD